MVGEDFSASLDLRHLAIWGCNSIGRVSALQAGCCRFESDQFHIKFTTRHAPTLPTQTLNMSRKNLS